MMAVHAAIGSLLQHIRVSLAANVLTTTLHDSGAGPDRMQCELSILASCEDMPWSTAYAEIYVNACKS